MTPARCVCPPFLREIDNGKDLPRELLEYLYNSVVSNEIKMLQHASSVDKSGV